MFYNLICGLIRVLFRWRIDAEGLEHMPKNGAVVVIANHRHMFDPVIIAITLKRPVSFMCKKELCANKFLNRFFRALRCIPIDRDNMDRAALRECVAVLKNEEVLGIFPEGTRAKTEDMLPFKSGATFVASQAPCVIVPMGIEGSRRLVNIFSKKVGLKVGEPFLYEALEGERRRDTLERMTKVQEAAVKALLKAPSEASLRR